MKPKLAKTIDDLIANYYGSRDDLSEGPATTEELFANYYGSPRTKRRRNANRKPAVVLSLSCDDDEILTQRRMEWHRPAAPAYRISPRPVYSAQTSFEDEVRTLAGQDVSPAREVEVDFASSSAAGEPPAAPPAPEPTYPAPSPDPLSATRPAEPKTSQASSTEDELAADLKAILSGQKVFDPVSGRTVDKGRAAEARAAQQSAAPPPAPANESQAIFDRIAQSMQHANAFDLGTVELQNRFADFDRVADLGRQAAEEKRAAKNRAATLPPAPPKPPVKPDSRDFLEDLDAIRNPRPGSGGPAPAYGLSLLPGDIAEALYETGEHVLAAETLYPDKFTIGKPPGVTFSYGQVIAMGDMFVDVSEMVTCSSAELQKLKTLIEQSTQYFKSGKTVGKDVSNEQWDAVTAGRFMRLAADNYDHFAPNILFKGSAFGKGANSHRDHKAAWERHHKLALQEAQKDPNLSDPAYFAHWPLLINAFGDHFLTDAFAAGHIVNKQAVIDYYRASFYTKGALTAEGREFFDKVAAKVFTGDVEKKFSVLETVDPHDAWWNIFSWNPNIDSPSRFAALLSGIAEKEPERIGNLAVKALHDKLNKDGIDVDNLAGSGSWPLTGDGYLTSRTRGIMRQAVQQSVANVLDPAIRTGTIDFPAYFAKVWQFVPVLTPASEAIVKAWTKDHVTPTSTVLIDGAAVLIGLEVDTMIKTLIDRKVLMKA